MDQLIRHCFGDNYTSIPLNRYVLSYFADLPKEYEFPSELKSVFVIAPIENVRNERKQSYDVCWKLDEIIDNSIKSAVMNSKRIAISQGYRKAGSYFSNQCATLASPILCGIESTCPNASVAFLRQTCWEELHQTVGDDFMHFLINQTTMVRLVNQAFVQLTGPLLTDLLKQHGYDLLKKQTTMMNTNDYSKRSSSIRYSSSFLSNSAKHTLGNFSARGLMKKLLIDYPFHKEGRNQQKTLRLWCESLLRNHRKCPYKKIFRKFFPAMASIDDPSNAIRFACNAADVSAFLKTIVLRLLPRNTFENARQRRLLLRSIHKLVSNPCFDKLVFDESIQGIAPRLCSMLFKDVLFTLMRSYFYCTEVSGSNIVWYWDKAVWAVLSKHAMNNMYEQQRFVHVETRPIDQCLKMRFVPKLTGGMRPIVNCKPLNFKFCEVYQAIKFAFKQHNENIQRKQILGVDEFYSLYKKFVMQVQGKFQNFKVMVLDVEQCFDNLEHDRTFECVRNILSSNEYSIQSVSNISANDCVKRVRNIIKHEVTSDTSTRVHVDIFDMAESAPRKSLLMERGENISLSPKEILAKVSNFLRRNYVRCSSQICQQIKGIPQGSVLSSILCTLYFEQFEQDHVDPLLYPNDQDGDCSFCTRLLDDYLIISTDPVRVERFREMMLHGRHDYKIRIKSSKTQSSSAESPLVNWCGFCINSKDLSITFDEQRLRGSRIVFGESFDEQKRQVFQVVMTRAYPVLFDSCINAYPVVMKNLQMLFGCAKQHAQLESRRKMYVSLAKYVYSILCTRTGHNFKVSRKVVTSLCKSSFVYASS